MPAYEDKPKAPRQRIEGPRQASPPAGLQRVTAAEFIARDGVFLVVVLLAVLWFHQDGLRAGLAFGLGGLVAVGIGYLIGTVWYEPRPFVVEHVAPLIPHAADASFPSDHLLVIGALFGAAIFTSRRISLAALVLAVLVAAARVYVRVHYPWDVAAGFAIGAGIGAIAYAACQWANPLLTWLDGFLQPAHLRPVLLGRNAASPVAAGGQSGIL